MFQPITISLFVISLLLSFILTFFYKRFAIDRSILDIPNTRSSHFEPIPRGGGIAILIAFYLGLLFLYLKGHIEKDLFFAFLPGVGLAIVGIFDDLRGLVPSIRIFTQILCSGFALYFLGGFKALFGHELTWVWSFVALIGIVWFINLFNFLDGSDGYASMEAISIALGLWFFTHNNTLLVLAFSVCGFLYWNWPKARIFMGDAGSTTLGFILVVFGIYFHNTHQLNFIFLILLTGLFWFDATITLFRRIYNKEKLSQAHKNHIYQRAILGGYSHLKVMLSGLVINLLLFGICFTILNKFIPYLLGFILTMLSLTFAMYYIERRFAYRK